jgi:hypothetical protein
MESSPKPNFFIVGAPKAGTTALYSYLRQHPEIFMCLPKEPQFFAADTCGDQRNVATLSEYLGYFKEARARAIGEASTCYLSSPGATRDIREFCPKARIIIMLRNPIDVMYAEHSERLVGGAEHIVNFAAALDSDEPRRFRSGRFKGQRVVRPGYRELVLFSQQVQRFFDAFGRPNVHVIVYDEFAKNAGLAYKDVLAFLGVSPNHECAFNVVNSNRRIRSTIVQDLVRHPPETVRKLARAFVPRSTRQRLATTLNRRNVQFVARPVMDQQLRKRLELEYVQEVQQLSRLVDRDLSKWITA